MSIFQDPQANDIENWVCVFKGGAEFQAELAHNYLSNLNIPSNILSKRDTAIGLNVGDLAVIFLYVPKEYEDKARIALAELEESHPDFNLEEGDSD